MTRMFSWLLYTFVFSVLMNSGKGENDILKFLKVQTASLSPTTVLKTVVSTTPEDCATTCLSTETCKSFEISINVPQTCLMYKEDTSERRMTRNSQYDFYQARQSKCPLNIVYGGALAGHNNLDRSKATFTKCVNRCQKEPKCKSIDINFGDNGCDMSSSSLLPLYVNTNGWNYVEVNRDILALVVRKPSSDQLSRNECKLKTPEGIPYFYKKLVDSSSEMAYFDLEYDPYIDIDNMLDIPVRSQVDCSVECLRSDDCIAFSYHSGEKKTCQLKRAVNGG